MIYLDTNQLGQDPKTVIFPSIQTCMGVAVIGNGVVYGMHFPSNPDLTLKFVGAAKYMSLGGMYTIIGITHKNRYGASAREGVTRELKKFCAAIYQNGRAYPIDVFGIVLPDPGTAGSHDARVSKNNGGVTVGYRDFVSVTTSQIAPDATTHRSMMTNGQIAPLYGDPLASVTTAIGVGDFTDVPPSDRFSIEVEGKKLASVVL